MHSLPTQAHAAEAIKAALQVNKFSGRGLACWLQASNSVMHDKLEPQAKPGKSQNSGKGRKKAKTGRSCLPALSLALTELLLQSLRGELLS